MKHIIIFTVLSFISIFLFCEGMDKLFVSSPGSTEIEVAMNPDDGTSEIPGDESGDAFPTDCDPGNLISESSVSIEGNTINLESFDYSEIKGTIEIKNTLLKNINNLKKLRIVSGNVILENNKKLKNINGLSCLDSLKGDIIITGNDLITLTKVKNLIQKIYSHNGFIEGRLIYNGTEIDIADIIVSVTTEI